MRVAFGALGFAGNVAKTALQTPVHVARVLTPEQEKQTIVDQWVDFLISQMDQEDEDEIAGKKFKVQPSSRRSGPWLRAGTLGYNARDLRVDPSDE